MGSYAAVTQYCYPWVEFSDYPSKVMGQKLNEKNLLATELLLICTLAHNKKQKGSKTQIVVIPRGKKSGYNIIAPYVEYVQTESRILTGVSPLERKAYTQNGRKKMNLFTEYLKKMFL